MTLIIHNLESARHGRDKHSALVQSSPERYMIGRKERSKSDNKVLFHPFSNTDAPPAIVIQPHAYDQKAAHFCRTGCVQR